MSVEQKAEYHKLTDGSIEVVCTAVADNVDCAIKLATLCDRLQNATTLLYARMIDDSQLRFVVKIVPHVPTNMEAELERVVVDYKRSIEVTEDDTLP